MRLVFIRHGQTPSNILIRYNGQMDEDIKEAQRGWEVAKQAIKDGLYDMIISVLSS